MPRTKATTAASQSTPTTRHLREGSRPSGNSTSNGGNTSNTSGSNTAAPTAAASRAGRPSEAAEYESNSFPRGTMIPIERKSQPIGLRGTRKHSTRPTVAHPNVGATGITTHERGRSARTARPIALAIAATEITHTDHANRCLVINSTN